MVTCSRDILSLPSRWGSEVFSLALICCWLSLHPYHLCWHSIVKAIVSLLLCTIICFAFLTLSWLQLQLSRPGPYKLLLYTHFALCPPPLTSAGYISSQEWNLLHMHCICIPFHQWLFDFRLTFLTSACARYVQGRKNCELRHLGVRKCWRYVHARA